MKINVDPRKLKIGLGCENITIRNSASPLNSRCINHNYNNINDLFMMSYEVDIPLHHQEKSYNSFQDFLYGTMEKTSKTPLSKMTSYEGNMFFRPKSSARDVTLKEKSKNIASISLYLKILSNENERSNMRRYTAARMSRLMQVLRKSSNLRTLQPNSIRIKNRKARYMYKYHII